MEMLVKGEELALVQYLIIFIRSYPQNFRPWQISCFYCKPCSSFTSVFGFECNT